MAVEGLLPSGPYKLVRGHALGRLCGAIVAWGVFGAIVLVMGQQATDRAAALLQDGRIASASVRREIAATWQSRSGVPTRSWKEQVFDWLLPTVQGTVSADLGGESRSLDVVLPLLWSRLENLPSLALVEASEVDRGQVFVTTTWHLATRVERGVRLGVDLALVAGIVWPVVWFARGAWRRARTAAHVAAVGNPWVADARFEPVGRRWRLMVRWNGRNGPQSLQVEQDPRHGAPFLVGPGKVLLLVDPQRPDLALVLRQRLWPLRLHPELVQSVVARVAALHPEPLSIPRA